MVNLIASISLTVQCWHPILRSLLADPNIPINEVWGLDAVNHGASVDLNAGRLGPGNLWRDNASMAR